MNKYCVSRGLPWIYAAAEELYGYVMLIVPCRTACLSCLYSVTPAERREIPVIGPAVTMVASIATMKLLELVRGEIKSELTYVDCRELTIEKLPDTEERKLSRMWQHMPCVRVILYGSLRGRAG